MRSILPRPGHGMPVGSAQPVGNALHASMDDVCAGAPQTTISPVVLHIGAGCGAPVGSRRRPGAPRCSTGPAAPIPSMVPAGARQGRSGDGANDMSDDDLQVRQANDDDLPQILEVLQSSLGWVPDAQYADFYRWKHHDNPFGRSPAWVAVDGDRIVGLRVWLRWRFLQAGRRWEAVRAVDTATHPDYQGRGIFRRLTTSSIEVLREQGVAHVFNTPNEQSRPGYLKMGWEEVGKLAVGVRFRSPLAAASAVRARVPADKWSLPTDVAAPAAEVLADDAEVAALIKGLDDTRIGTDLDVEVLRWRYGFGPLHYRGVREAGGIALFRLRKRGPATECVVGHVLAPDEATAGRLLRRIAKVSGADQVLQITDRPHLRGGFVPLPGGGPIFTWRALAESGMPPLDRWELTMGDIELF